MNIGTNVTTEVLNKSVWVRPTLRRIEAGSAESQRGPTGDGSGQQGS